MLISGSVLLADDHEEFLGIVARHLEPHFEVVRTVHDGQSVLEEAARLEPDMIVLDICMPVLDGFQTAIQLRALGCRARVVFLTAYGDPDYVQAAFEAGALGYVLKSELASDLLSSLQDALAGRRFVSPALGR